MKRKLKRKNNKRMTHGINRRIFENDTYIFRTTWHNGRWSFKAKRKTFNIANDENYSLRA